MSGLKAIKDRDAEHRGNRHRHHKACESIEYHTKRKEYHEAWSIARSESDHFDEKRSEYASKGNKTESTTCADFSAKLDGMAYVLAAILDATSGWKDGD